MNSSLSSPAMSVISGYLNLSIKGKIVTCPYYNNRRKKIRAAMRVAVGKGTPKEIAEEAELIAMKEKTDLEAMAPEQIKFFLVDHGLGVDCSGLAYHVLNAETKFKNKHPLRLVFPQIKNPLRKLIAKLRPAENTDVRVLANPANSETVDVGDVRAGDLIFFLSREESARDHVLVIHATNEDGGKKEIFYTHSFQVPKDGMYGHGVRQGKITVEHPTKKITEQKWTEKELFDKINKCEVEIKRLKILN